MLELALRILFCLLLAALLGFIVGWLLGRLRARRETEAERLEWEGKLKDCEDRLSAAGDTLETQQRKLGLLEADLSTIKDRTARLSEVEAELSERAGHYDTLEVELSAHKRTLAKRDRQVQDLSADLNACRANTASLQAQLSQEDTHRQTLAAAASNEAEIQRLQAHIGGLNSKLRAYASGRLPGALAARPATFDNLADIRGVGPVLAQALNDMGIYYFRQVAEWTDVDIDFVDSRVEKFQGRIRREDWVGSARKEHFKKYGASL